MYIAFVHNSHSMKQYVKTFRFAYTDESDFLIKNFLLVNDSNRTEFLHLIIILQIGK